MLSELFWLYNVPVLYGEIKSVIMFSQGLCVQLSKNESNQFIYYLYIFILYVK